MGEVIAHLAMWLDGFVADPDDGCDELVGFYATGEVPLQLSAGFPELHVSRRTAKLLTAEVARRARSSPAAGCTTSPAARAATRPARSSAGGTGGWGAATQPARRRWWW
jgi:hypothetical protein